MKVDLGYLKEVLDYLRKIEQEPLEDIKWYKKGVLQKVSPIAIEAWSFTGLNNRDFARDQFLGEPSNFIQLFIKAKDANTERPLQPTEQVLLVPEPPIVLHHPV